MAITEVIPYLGPWLGSIPPFIYAIVVHPISALWVALLFLGIHQIEGHVVVPNVMGNALRLHPLLVIFGLAAGAEIYGLPGALIALPLLASCRAVWEYFVDRIHFEWDVVRARAGGDRPRRSAAGDERSEMTPAHGARRLARLRPPRGALARPTSPSSRERWLRSSGRTGPGVDPALDPRGRARADGQAPSSGTPPSAGCRRDPRTTAA